MPHFSKWPEMISDGLHAGLEIERSGFYPRLGHCMFVFFGKIIDFTLPVPLSKCAIHVGSSIFLIQDWKRGI